MAKQRTRAATRRKRAKLPQNVHRHGDGYRGRVMRDGTRHVGPTFDTPEEAGRWVEHFRKAATTAETTGGPITLDEAMDLVRADMRADGVRPGTLRFAESKFTALTRGWPGATSLHRIGAPQIRAYVQHRRDHDGCGNVTIHGELGLLKRLFKVAKREGRLHASPFDDGKVRMPKLDGRRYSHLTRADIESMLAAIRAVGDKRPKARWDADIIEFLFLTGLRRSELARLRVADVDLFRRTLRIDGKRGNRTVFLSNEAKVIATRLVAAAESTGHLVPSAKGTEVHRAGVVSQVLARWKDRLKLDLRGAAHVMRHSFATAAIENGVDPLALREAGGWRSMDMVARYYHASESRLRAVADAVANGKPEKRQTGTT